MRVKGNNWPARNIIAVWNDGEIAPTDVGLLNVEERSETCSQVPLSSRIQITREDQPLRL
jgi:hypothetical protein